MVKQSSPETCQLETIFRVARHFSSKTDFEVKMMMNIIVVMPMTMMMMMMMTTMTMKMKMMMMMMMMMMLVFDSPRTWHSGLGQNSENLHHGRK